MPTSAPQHIPERAHWDPTSQHIIGTCQPAAHGFNHFIPMYLPTNSLGSQLRAVSLALQDIDLFFGMLCHPDDFVSLFFLLTYFTPSLWLSGHAKCQHCYGVYWRERWHIKVGAFQTHQRCDVLLCRTSVRLLFDVKIRFWRDKRHSNMSSNIELRETKLLWMWDEDENERTFCLDNTSWIKYHQFNIQIIIIIWMSWRSSSW